MVEKTDVLPPARVLAGKYRLGRLIGEGGMGTVYEAEHTGLGSQVAVKLLTERYAEDEDALQRFRREARASAAVRHENVVRVTDTGTDDDGVPFLVMELLDGESLNAILKRQRRLDADAAAAIANEALEGLAAAHEKGVIHRDLKPGNVFLSNEADGTQKAKILDFGISKYGDEAITRELTAEGAVVGTPQYMPPEQVAGKKDLDARADVYAVGVLLYRMVTGRLPFVGDTPQKLYESILRGDPTPPRAIRADIPPELEKVILEAMAADREQRYQNARSMQRALAAALPSMPGRIPTLTPPPSSSRVDENDPSAAPTVKASPSVEAGRGDAPPQPPVGTAAPHGGASSPRPRWQLGLVASVGALAAAVAVIWALSERGDGDGGTERRDEPGGEIGGAGETGGAAAPGDAGAEPIVFGIPGYAPQEEVREDHRDTADYLSKTLQRPVEIRVFDPTLGISGPLREGEVQLAALSPVKYLRAKKELDGLRLLATPVRHGGSWYQGLILARADADIETLGDLEGKVFCYVDESSTSGYVYPRAILRRSNIDPDADFEAVKLTGDHLKSLKYLHNGECDAAAVYRNMLEIEASKHGMRPDQFYVIERTGRIPYDAYVVPPSVSDELAEELRKALLALSPKSEAAAEVFGPDDDITGFTEVTDGEYDPVRKIEAYLDDAQ